MSLFVLLLVSMPTLYKACTGCYKMS